MRIVATLTLSASIFVSAFSFGQTPPRGAATTAPSARFVAIGCLSQQGTAAAPRYVVTDTRGDTRTVYRLTSDAAVLGPHVGHTVEVSGPLATSAGAQNVLKVNTLVWIASTCKK